MGHAECDRAKLGLLLQRSTSTDRVGVAATDGAVMSARQHEIVDGPLGADGSWQVSRLSLKVRDAWACMARSASAIREFAAPRYRPELHYMRGPGPACARGRKR